MAKKPMPDIAKLSKKELRQLVENRIAESIAGIANNSNIPPGKMKKNIRKAGKLIFRELRENLKKRKKEKKK